MSKRERSPPADLGTLTAGLAHAAGTVEGAKADLQDPEDQDTGRPAKKTKKATAFLPNKIATAEAAAKVDVDPPLQKLLQAVKDGVKNPGKGEAVVYWMRMEDLRTCDNRALSRASAQAQKDGIPLVLIFTVSPQDYVAHDRSPRRIDFTLRNLADIKAQLASLHIPLYVTVHTPRRTIPERVVALLQGWKARHLFANIEYEVDELRRDIKVCELAKPAGIGAHFVHDRCLVDPGIVLTKNGRVYTVYSPFQRNWLDRLNSNLKWIEEEPLPLPNSEDIYFNTTLKALFDVKIPDHVDGFECKDRETMRDVWPTGTEAAKQILARFLHTKARSTQMGPSNPLSEGAESSEKKARALVYKDSRDKADKDTTSRLSPYLAAGVISARECVRQAMKLQGLNKIQATRDTGLGTWLMEIAWRDFYNHVLSAYPRVSMGRPFQEKYANVKWEVNDEHFQAWKEGRTGLPIVDAGMRQVATMGWMHNRLRMITATYLVKDLMIDWRLGEKYFMEILMDGDLASNNGGWQWSASTGTDPQPYFRIFNPYSQSEKADPTGDYIRHFVPELRDLRGPEIHKPPEKVCRKLGYPLPLVKHEEARQRALRRYKNPGEE
ncbi:hypothetical protein NEOLEDRAFT_1177049 [Neolentinus lepideus HHB14362 ss-1]|uniref:Photolyase/cryptochrome alpha/beta domain-containing protein n=1 Tax=Neolentinus lepideus HHB14362 ss-1 TaxID=1314782 RepID=A0A165TLR5_9AGAM|nr:hypothetical protein NEOLEDRAFT_1177049 [Neolentinus lepideus HHB14362 ss-1]